MRKFTVLTFLGTISQSDDHMNNTFSFKDTLIISYAKFVTLAHLSFVTVFITFHCIDGISLQRKCIVLNFSKKKISGCNKEVTTLKRYIAVWCGMFHCKEN